MKGKTIIIFCWMKIMYAKRDIQISVYILYKDDDNQWINCRNRKGKIAP